MSDATRREMVAAAMPSVTAASAMVSAKSAVTDASEPRRARVAAARLRAGASGGGDGDERDPPRLVADAARPLTDCAAAAAAAAAAPPAASSLTMLDMRSAVAPALRGRLGGFRADINAIPSATGTGAAVGTAVRGRRGTRVERLPPLPSLLLPASGLGTPRWPAWSDVRSSSSPPPSATMLIFRPPAAARVGLGGGDGTKKPERVAARVGDGGREPVSSTDALSGDALPELACRSRRMDAMRRSTPMALLKDAGTAPSGVAATSAVDMPRVFSRAGDAKEAVRLRCRGPDAGDGDGARLLSPSPLLLPLPPPPPLPAAGSSSAELDSHAASPVRHGGRGGSAAAAAAAPAAAAAAAAAAVGGSKLPSDAPGTTLPRYPAPRLCGG